MICSKCKEEVSPTSWSLHKLMHEAKDRGEEEAREIAALRAEVARLQEIIDRPVILSEWQKLQARLSLAEEEAKRLRDALKYACKIGYRGPVRVLLEERARAAGRE